MQTSPQTPRKLRNFLSFLFKVSLTLVAFWFALRDVHPADLLDTFKQQQLSGLLLATLCICIQVILGALRWRYILVSLSELGKEVMAVGEAIRLYFVSVFFSCCLPGTIGGDVVRIWITKSHTRPMALSVNSIVLDRLLALAGLFVIILTMLPMLADVLGFNFWMVLAAITCLLFVGIWSLLRIELFLKSFPHSRLAHWALFFINCLRLLLRNSGTSFYALVSAIGAHIFFCISAYIIAGSMGVTLSLTHALMFMPLVMLFTTLPISIGGWGVREASIVWFLALVGIPSTAAVAISVQLGLLGVLVSLPGVLFWLAFKRQQAENPGNA